MNDHDIPNEIPDDLAAPLHAAAGAAPPYPGDLAAVRRRRQAMVRHRAVTATGLAAAGVAVALSLPFALAGEGAGQPATGQTAGGGVSATAATAPAEPAQRLLLRDSGSLEIPAGMDPDLSGDPAELYQRYRDRPGVAGLLLPASEVLPDGSVVALDLDLPGVDSVQQVVEMPGGRLAAIGLVDRMPGADRQDGSCVEGLETPLLVVEPDGSVSRSRDVRQRCHTLTLVAADAETAYLLRDATLVAHDLATGEEQTLLDSVAAESVDHGGVGYAGGLVVTLVNHADCAQGGPEVRVTDLATGDTAAHPLPGDGCRTAFSTRVSPDGSYAAVAYERYGDGSRQQRAAIVDLASGAVVVDRPITETAESQPAPEDAEVRYSGAIAGLGWDDGRTVRVAYYDAPEGDGAHWVPDLIQVEALTVPGD